MDNEHTEIKPSQHARLGGETDLEARLERAKIAGEMSERRLRRVPKGMRGSRHLSRVLFNKECELREAFRDAHEREPNYYEQQAMETAMVHCQAAAVLSRLMDHRWKELTIDNVASLTGKIEEAADKFLKVLEKLKLETRSVSLRDIVAIPVNRGA